MSTSSSVVPKQWALGKSETLSSFECWKNNITYVLALNKDFTTFMTATWEKKSKTAPKRGLIDGTGQTADQRLAILELMLGQVANYAPIISRRQVVNNSTSLEAIWQMLRLHYGFSASGGQFLDFAAIKFEPEERPEDLFQKLQSFIDDSLLTPDRGLKHHGAVVSEEEDLSPTTENLVILRWLELMNPSLPKLVQQRYGTELRNHTLASIKPEISKALPSLLEELECDAKVFRTFQPRVSYQDQRAGNTNFLRNKPKCSICSVLQKPSGHFTSRCPHLSADDRKFFTRGAKLRQVTIELDEEEFNSLHLEEDDHVSDSLAETPPGSARQIVVMEDDSTAVQNRRVRISQSPYFDVFHKQHPVRLTLDSGATGNVINEEVARRIGCTIRPTAQQAGQADGQSRMNIVGETSVTFTRGHLQFKVVALVASTCDAEFLASNSFLEDFDITIRPAKKSITFSDGSQCLYGQPSRSPTSASLRAVTLRQSAHTVILPGQYLELQVPDQLGDDGFIAIEPSINTSAQTSPEDQKSDWLVPSIVPVVAGRVRVPNTTKEPVRFRKHQHVCVARPVVEIDHSTQVQPDTSPVIRAPAQAPPVGSYYSDPVSIDPQQILNPEIRSKFQSLCRKYDEVFDPAFPGYNGHSGPFRNVVNMGPTLPPQRKGRVPQYSKDKLDVLQKKFDELESLGVFARPEDVGVTIEYLNPSFLVAKSTPGTYRLVTAFGDVGRHAKPQPALMSDVDKTLRTVGQWKYLIKADLTSAFYQIPLDRDSMKYCGVATPFRGVRVYQRSAMGMPGSESALENLMSDLLGDLVMEGCIAKIADDLFCGANNVDDLLVVWERLLHILAQNALRLSASKTVLCPKAAQILGWTWSDGTLNATAHRLAALSAVAPPPTVTELRTFIGAYKVLARVLPDCAHLIAPLDSLTAGKQSSDPVPWTDESLAQFERAKQSLTNHKSITIPQPGDQLWIVTDGATKKPGLGATLYITRNGQRRLAGFFSAKLRDRQHTWLPCEIEALAIHCSVSHWAPFITQSALKPVILTDSKPCVQAFEKLCRGEFSTSPRVSTFLSTCCRYQALVQHLSGTSNISSDFASRNAPECTVENCQVCSFIRRAEGATVLAATINDVENGTIRAPFTSRAAWVEIQAQCPDVRRAKGYLESGTRPNKKQTKIRDVKRYIQSAKVAADDLLVVSATEPLCPARERIVVPRSVLDGLLLAWHLQLSHPTAHQLLTVFKRYFFALDLEVAVKKITNTCHHCNSLKPTPTLALPQSTEEPPTIVGQSFAADVLRLNRQCIFVIRETVTSFTRALIVSDERHDTLRSAIIETAIPLVPLDGTTSYVRTDPAPGFQKLVDDKLLAKHRLRIVLGEAKNKNKNPVAEKAIQELEGEIARAFPNQGLLSSAELAIAVNNLNARIRNMGLSSREMICQRDQFSGEQLPLRDQAIILAQHEARLRNHPYSERSKQGPSVPRNGRTPTFKNGELIYIYSDQQKGQARPRYIVTGVLPQHVKVRKFIGSQLRAKEYTVLKNDCFHVIPTTIQFTPTPQFTSDVVDDHEITHHVPPPNEEEGDLGMSPESEHGYVDYNSSETRDTELSCEPESCDSPPPLGRPMRVIRRPLTWGYDQQFKPLERR